MTLEDRVGPQVSVVVPVFNEAGYLEMLVGEIEAAMQAFPGYELICVDDGSTDGTAAELARLATGRPWLLHLRHPVRCGRSAALRSGVLAARASLVATLDGNGRDDPAAIPHMVAELTEAGSGCGLVAGQRIGRRDSAMRRFRSKIANSVRAALLDDGTRDAGCGLKCFPRAIFLDLPYFDGMHRFLPALIRCDGYAISLIDVTDRPSRRPDAEPGLFSGGWRAICDLIGVTWLIRRRGHAPALWHASAGVPPDRTGRDDPVAGPP